MKHIFKYLFSAVALIMVLTACEKKAEDMPLYSNGTASVLTSSVATVAASAADSSSQVITFNWSDPKYAAKNSKYIFQMDAAGNGFSNPVTRTLTDSLHTSFTGKEINDIILGFGFDINVAGNVETRVISSYANNNEQYTSNSVTVQMTPYKIPPKVGLPSSGKLFLVGDATQGGWNNPVPVPTQEFSHLDETTFAGIFRLIGGKEFLVLPENGNWDLKFALADNSLPGIEEAGNFGYFEASNPSAFTKNFKGPVTDGLYKIVLDFQRGRYTITPYSSVLPDKLFVVGDATADQWNNTVPSPGQELTRINSSEFSITMPLFGGKQYLLLPVNGDWGHKYAVRDNTIPGYDAAGEFGYDFGSNFPGPATDGTYTISVNFAAATTVDGASGAYKVTN